MNETKHTPGPWTVLNRQTSAIPSFLIVNEGGALGIARTLKNEKGDVKTQEANARLIAAAPDLLEALKATLALEVHATPESAYINKLVLAAIAKAEGRA